MLASLGKITVASAGTPVRLTSVLAIPGNHVPAQGVVIQALSGNTGKIFIGLSTMNKTTLAGVLFILAVPTTNIIPSFSVSQLSTAGVGVEDLWIDADNTAEGVTAAYVQG